MCIHCGQEDWYCEHRASSSRKRILIIGHGTHGKDTTAEIIKELFGYSFRGSSEVAAEIFLYEALKEKYGYKTPIECFNDRANHRKEWHDLICEYNTPDKARLAKEIVNQADIYVGMRDNEECEESLRQGLFDMVIGVWDYRKPLESAESFNINIWKKSDIILLNTGTPDDLKNRIKKLSHIFK